jgi:hypothetical protein
MTTQQRLGALCATPGGQARIELLSDWLPTAERRGFAAGAGLRPGTNLVVSARSPRLVLGAHHDIDPGTEQGALDNAAAVVVLVELAHRLAARGDLPDVEIAFWDYEEPANGSALLGSRRHARQLERAGAPVELVVALDVIGLGGPLVADTGRRAAYRLAAALEQIDGTAPVLLPTPPSDHVSFYRAGFDAALLSSVHPERGTAAWRYLHSRGDSLDKIDIASLAPMVTRLERLAEALHQEGSLHPWRTLQAPALQPVQWRHGGRSRTRRRRPAPPPCPENLDLFAGLAGADAEPPPAAADGTAGGA